MKQRKRRGGSVDGVRRESLAELAALLGITDQALGKYANKRGLEFDYRGHHIIMDPQVRANKKGGPYVLSLDSVHARKPIEPMERIQFARKSYNEQGVASRGLLIRK